MFQMTLSRLHVELHNGTKNVLFVLHIHVHASITALSCSLIDSAYFYVRLALRKLLFSLVNMCK
jgi:hypothetical protein